MTVARNRGAQIVEQRIKGRPRVGFQQECFDGVEAFEKAGGQFDPIRAVSHACGRACQQ